MSLPDNPLRLSIPDWGRTLGLKRAAAYAAVHRLGLAVSTDGLVDVAAATAVYVDNTQVRVTNKPGVDVRLVHAEALGRAAYRALRAGTFDPEAELTLRHAIDAIPKHLEDDLDLDLTVWDRLYAFLFEPGTKTNTPEYRAK